MPADPGSSPPVDATGWLRLGHAREAEGTPASLVEAVRAYDVVIALLRAAPLAGHDATRRELGGAWMNRGNALQKQCTPASLADAVRAYDEAIAVLQLLPIATNPAHRNCLGSAWMNRGHALLQLGDAPSHASAIHSHETAVALLRALPFEEISAYRLNLAGAEVNLANALLLAADSAGDERARAAAAHACDLVAGQEDNASEFADLGLKARRARCDAIGRLLFTAAHDQAAVARLAAEASDAVDSGLALARRWEIRDVPHFRPLAGRLFFFGAQLYQLHQPHFLAEFLLENLDPASAPLAWASDAGLHDIAAIMLARARQELAQRPLLNSSDAATAKLLETSRGLAAAEERLAQLRQELLPTAT